ncbi:uncharacterized protein Nmag_3085 [Natrialba magadii ATCC 43099]|uniref:Uncharacterized protein n=1 Tax=Natrialba magadii (strain ATCC 43099 / DSM 3394 / CCM 3739 / CIP 104546 / IAM 13178 / JCM 8861 / NBRC 102185 / NCIMB 2190 / MS3) TaxID=547559 RepID=D3SR81_NATMM|nr:hypothetical protein [Natrialba magadii]ADD06637.1 uncharacterized protein Nmag_3085 [Natrialba magadii ATCC 43099]ELY31902.1 hypothetical protein C500_04973 [Natrialba magadii ATCC 43099]
MPRQTYRLAVSETDDGAGGLDATIYDEDEAIVASTRVASEEYDFEPPSQGVSDAETSFTADVTTIDLQFVHDSASIVFRVLGDRDEIATVRLPDEGESVG